MKLKSIKTLKNDVSGILGSNFKLFRSSKDIKSNIYSKLSRNLKRKRVNKNYIFELKFLLSKARSKQGFIYASSKNPKNLLDFSSANTKNVFLRTKRKSSFGQTLLEKQRLKKYIPHMHEKEFKTYFNSENKSKDNSNFSIFDHVNYVLNSSTLFGSKNYIKGRIVSKDIFFYDVHSKTYSYLDKGSSNINYSFPKLKCVPVYDRGHGNDISFPIFNRVLPNNVLHDIRINKFRVVNDVDKENTNRLPFDSDLKKIIQHYRLKRN